MNVYLIQANFEGFKSVYPTEYFWEEIAPLCDGSKKIADNLKLIELELDEDDEALRDGDFMDTSVTYLHVVGESAKLKLDTRLGSLVEFLPSNLNGHQMFIMNVLAKVDTFSEEKSEFEVLDDSGLIISMNKLVLDDYSELPMIFRLERMPFGGVYVTQEFKDFCDQLNLTGLEFVKQVPER